jgi:hypothetical protein
MRRAADSWSMFCPRFNASSLQFWSSLRSLRFLLFTSAFRVFRGYLLPASTPQPFIASTVPSFVYCVIKSFSRHLSLAARVRFEVRRSEFEVQGCRCLPASTLQPFIASTVLRFCPLVQDFGGFPFGGIPTSTPPAQTNSIPSPSPHSIFTMHASPAPPFLAMHRIELGRRPNTHAT